MSCLQTYLLCQKLRKRRRGRRRPQSPPVLLRWPRHLQSTRPARGSTVRLKLLLINYYLWQKKGCLCGSCFSRITVYVTNVSFHQNVITNWTRCLDFNKFESNDPGFCCVCLVAITQGGAIQLAGPGGEAIQGVQALTFPGPATPQPGATILQYSPQAGDPSQQLLLSAGQVLVQGKTPELCLLHLLEEKLCRNQIFLNSIFTQINRNT